MDNFDNNFTDEADALILDIQRRLKERVLKIETTNFYNWSNFMTIGTVNFILLII